MSLVNGIRWEDVDSGGNSSAGILFACVPFLMVLNIALPGEEIGQQGNINNLNIQQAFASDVINRTTIPVMFCRFHPSGTHRILMNIHQPLVNKIGAVQFDGVIVSLPKLVQVVVLIKTGMVLHEKQQPIAPTFLLGEVFRLRPHIRWTLSGAFDKGKNTR
mgnify:CR=1 FL=1